MTADPPPRTGGPRLWAWGLALAALYALSGRLGLALAHVQENATLVWPPTGLALGVLVVVGARLWPAVLVGALLVNLSIDTPPTLALEIAGGNTLEAVVGATLLRRLRVAPDLSTMSSVLWLLFVGGVLAPMVSATIGVGALVVGERVAHADAPLVWLIWWLGDVGGAVVVAPFVLLVVHGQPPWRALVTRPEAWAVLAALVVVGGAAFGGVLDGPWALFAALGIFPFLVWAGLRLGPRGAVTAGVIVAALAITGTAEGRGPFVDGSMHVRLLLLWAYVATFGASALLLAAAVATRDRADVERARADAERRAIERQMLHAQRLEGLGLLASGIAHDFNNLLVSVRGNAELLRVDAPLDGEQRTMIEEIDDAAVRAAELCRTLLVYAGRSVPELRPVALATIVDDVVRLLRGTISRDVTVTVALPPELPAVSGDPSQLRQVFMNLILNAAEALSARGGTVTVGARAVGGARDVVEVTVKDDGPGMDASTAARVFDPFFSTKRTGRGLGLAAVAGIVSVHGGAIDVTSAPGQGTTFRFTLRTTGDAPSPEAARAAVPPPAAPTTRTVLLADDEDGVRRLARRALERAGFHVIEAKDGLEAIALARAHTGDIDVVVLDVTMPRQSGPDALKTLRAERPTVRTILMSGLEGDIAQGVADVFLQKPFAVPDLLASVHALSARAPPT